MNEFENAPINVSANLFALSIKFNALKESLNVEQLERYNQIIEKKKEESVVFLTQLLPSESIDEFLRLLE